MQLEKVTRERQSEAKRRYDDACGTAHALELIGDRWTLLVLRELMLGSRRFSELRGDLPGISANVLAQRLVELERRGLARKLRLPPPASVQVYEATAWGLEAEPIVQALGRWAARSPAHDPSLPFSAASLMLSLRTMLDPARAAGIDARIGFRLGAEAFLAHLAQGRIEIAHGPLDDVDLVFTGTPPVLAAAIYGGQPFDALEAEGALLIEGDRALAERFTGLFPLPPKALAPA